MATLRNQDTPESSHLLLVRSLPSTSQMPKPPLGSEGPQVPIHWRVPIWMVSAFISHVILPTTTSCKQCYHAFTTVTTLKKHEKTEGICWSEASNLGGVSICSHHLSPTRHLATNIMPPPPIWASDNAPPI